jgi:hypothetical protein
MHDALFLQAFFLRVKASQVNVMIEGDFAILYG